MSSRDLTFSPILVMSGAPGPRRGSWTLRIGAPSGDDRRIQPYMVAKSPLTTISGDSPQGGFPHLSRKIRSLAIFSRTLIKSVTYEPNS